MDAAHKAKLAQGRKDAQAVKAYLEFLDEHRPKRGRRRTKESITSRLARIDEELKEASPLAKLNLYQEQMDLRAELDAMGKKVDSSQLRAGFVQAAGRYAASKGLTKSAFKLMGVPPEDLRDAGIR